jgi:hypothetical protein
VYQLCIDCVYRLFVNAALNSEATMTEILHQYRQRLEYYNMFSGLSQSPYALYLQPINLHSAVSASDETQRIQQLLFPTLKAHYMTKIMNAPGNCNVRDYISTTADDITLNPSGSSHWPLELYPQNTNFPSDVAATE